MFFGKSTSELSIILDPNQLKDKNVTPEQILKVLQGKKLPLQLELLPLIKKNITFVSSEI